jgi:hypothetical protein
MVGRLQPLANNFAIVGPDGKPTEYFIRWAQQRQIDISEAIDENRALEIIQAFIDDYQLQAGSGISITPDGKLTSNPTISAEAQAILNQISSTHGAVLFRGATNWQALAPGTSGHFLRTNGANADPSWAAGGGGGGGGSPLYPTVNPDPAANSGALSPNHLVVSMAFCHSATPVTGIGLLTRTVTATQQAIPAIYNAGPASSLTTLAPNNATLVATGPSQTLVSDRYNLLPLNSVFTPIAGNVYFVGITSHSGTANFNCGAAPFSRRAWWITAGFNPPPATFPNSGISNGTGTYVGWWTY